MSRAVVVATGITANGDREVLGLAVGDSEDKTFWADLLRSLRARGLAGVRLVVSDHHLGLKEAITEVMIGAGWQRCRVHLMRNLLARVPRANAEMVAAAVRTIFAQPDAAAVGEQFERIVAMLDGQFPDVAAALRAARDDLLAFTAFPLEHWRKLWSINPLERLHREIKRRCDVVGVFPHDAAIDRLVTAVIVEQHDEWQSQRPPLPVRNLHGPTPTNPRPAPRPTANTTTTRQLNRPTMPTTGDHFSTTWRGVITTPERSRTEDARKAAAFVVLAVALVLTLIAGVLLFGQSDPFSDEPELAGYLRGIGLAVLAAAGWVSGTILWVHRAD